MQDVLLTSDRLRFCRMLLAQRPYFQWSGHSSHILDQHKHVYDGAVTQYVKPEVQPLYVQDLANDKGGITVNNKGEVKKYTNMKINEEIDEMELVAKCLVHAFDNEEIYESDTLDEAKKFIESLSSAQFAKVSEFFEKAPQLTHTFSYKCEGCGQEDTVTLSGIADFF